MSDILRYFYGFLTIRTWEPYFIWELLLLFYVYAAILYCLILYNSLFWLPACLKRYSLLKTTNPHFVVISMFDNLSICISARCTKSGFYHRPGTPCSMDHRTDLIWSDFLVPVIRWSQKIEVFRLVEVLGPDLGNEPLISERKIFDFDK